MYQMRDERFHVIDEHGQICSGFDDLEDAYLYIADNTPVQCCKNSRGFVGGKCDYCDGVVSPEPHKLTIVDIKSNELQPL